MGEVLRLVGVGVFRPPSSELPWLAWVALVKHPSFNTVARSRICSLNPLTHAVSVLFPTLSRQRHPHHSADLAELVREQDGDALFPLPDALGA